MLKRRRNKKYLVKKKNIYIFFKIIELFFCFLKVLSTNVANAWRLEGLPASVFEKLSIHDLKFDTLIIDG